MANLETVARTLGRMHETAMNDECQILDESDEQTFNEETGEYEAADPTLVYEGRCRVIPVVSNARDRNIEEVGEALLTVTGYTVHLPREVEGIHEGHIIVLTTSLDPALDGRRLRVSDVVLATHEPTRRVLAQDQRETDEGTS